MEEQNGVQEKKTTWTSPKFIMETTVTNVKLKFRIHVSFEFGIILKTFLLNLRKKKKTSQKNCKGRLSAQPYKKISTWHKENNWQLSSVLTCPWSYPMVSCLFEYKGQKRPHECPQNRTLLALTCPAKKHYVFIRRSLELLTPTTRMPLCLNAVLINDCIF